MKNNNEKSVERFLSVSRQRVGEVSSAKLTSTLDNPLIVDELDNAVYCSSLGNRLHSSCRLKPEVSAQAVSDT